MNDIQRIEPGARMSEAVIHGNKIYTAGIVADKTVGKSVLEQTREVLQQIDAILGKAGTDKTRILKANIWLTDIKTFDHMNQAWTPGRFPAKRRRALRWKPSWRRPVMTWKS